MGNQVLPEMGSGQTLVSVTITGGRLMVKANLPLGWTLTLLATGATAAGYPAITGLITRVLHGG